MTENEQDFTPGGQPDNGETRKSKMNSDWEPSRDDQVPLGRLPGIFIALLGLLLAWQICSHVNIVGIIFDEDGKKDYYTTISSVMSSILGFEIAAATIFLAIRHEEIAPNLAKLNLLKPLFLTFIKAVVFSGISLVFSLVGLLPIGRFRRYRRLSNGCSC